MNEQFQEALSLRKKSNYEESKKLFLDLVKRNPDHASINYQCAWSYDLLGEEKKAVPFYEQAIKLGLIGADLEGAYIGLGSTYRTLGEYIKSKEILLGGIEKYPNNKAIKVFLSMTLYNLKEYKKATELLLTILLDTTKNEDIIIYRKAIKLYTENLDNISE